MIHKLINWFKETTRKWYRVVKSENKAYVNVEARVHDVDDLKKQVDNWRDLSKQEKLKVANNTEPEKVVKDHNTTVDGLNEYIVDNLDSNQSVNKDATHLGVGTGTATPATGNSSLNSSVDRFAITDTSDNGKDLFTSTFLDTSEANGNDLEEVGLFTADTGGTMLNHSLIQTISKDDTVTATIDVTLEFRAA